MKHIINKLSALILMLMCVSATMQAEIVHHEVCQPTLTSRGFTRECWENTETGQIYADENCTQELVNEDLAKAVTYMLLRENPIVNTSEFSQSQKEYAHDVKLRWAATSSYFFDASTFHDIRKHGEPRYAKFKVTADNVSYARLVWHAVCGGSTGSYSVTIYVNDEVKYLNTWDDYRGYDNLFVLPLPELKKGDVVKFETTQTGASDIPGQGAAYKASLEYVGRFANDDNIPPLVYHEEKAPTLNAYGYAREWWEDTNTGKYYSNPFAVDEFDTEELLKTFVYEKLPNNPIISATGFNQSENETQSGVKMNWAAVGTFVDIRYEQKNVEFKILTGEEKTVTNARLVWFRDFGSSNYGSYVVKIYVNGTERYSKGQDGSEGFNIVSLPGLKKDDVVRFEVSQTKVPVWEGNPTFKACLEYNVVCPPHEYPEGSAICSLCGYVKPHVHTQTETCSLCGDVDPDYTVLSGYVGKDNLEDIKWVLNRYNVLTFTGTGEMEPYNEEHNAWNKNPYKYDITKVVIGEGITKFGEGNIFLFNEMYKLTEVSLPSTLKEIGSHSFRSLNNLTSITLPEGLEIIRNSAFSSLMLKNIVIPASVTSIEEHAFYNDKLKSITLNGSPTIGSEAFASNSLLTDVYLMSDKEVTAADNAFGNNLSKVTLHVNNSLLKWAKTTSPWSSFGTIVPRNDYNVEYTDAEGNKSVEKFDIGASNNAFTLTDGCKQLAIYEDIPLQTLTYTRSFSAANTWQALYVPFEMEYDDWKEKFDVAAISNFHEYTNENGVTESIELEVRYVKAGKLRANTPYLIRAKAAGEQTIVLNDVTLMATEARSIDCSSTERKYTFTGTYDAIDKLKTKDYIFMSGGRLSKANNDAAVLKSMRWYLTIKDYFSVTGNAVPALAKPMMIRMIDDDETTDIENISVVSSPLNAKASGIFSITGAKLTKLQRGINIVNGKKIVVK